MCINLHRSAVLATVLAACSATGVAHANLLTDPGFESNPLTTLSNIATNFVAFQNQWGPEMGTITPATGGVTPAGGVLMHSMTNAGGVATQTWQAINVSSFSALISTGTATVNASVLLNTVGGYTGASASVAVYFFSASNFGSQITNVGTGLLLDANPQTWEVASVSATIPSATTWMIFQVAYNNASLSGNAGFADDASLTIVPTPGAAALLGLGGLAAARRRRR
ncbi:MAG: hypothetical protein LW822_02140 [Phycisphaeraceae bacterium]|jgi:MYXO-CTERM domain-containing protein|nr:hypothetical protein [Phycisphaeraceae bacterium]